MFLPIVHQFLPFYLNLSLTLLNPFWLNFKLNTCEYNFVLTSSISLKCWNDESSKNVCLKCEALPETMD